MTRREILALYLAAVNGRAATNEPRDYPQWRGQSRDGSASAFIEPDVWPEALKHRWQVDVGEGYGTPLVIGDTVYVFVRRGDKEVMAALSASTGRELWHAGYAAPYTPFNAAAAHGAGPKATPAFCDGKLFTLGISGIVSAFDVSAGKLLWRTDDPPEPALFGAASSPVAEAGLAITHPGGYGPLTAFDAETGTAKWTAGEQGFFSAPTVADLAGTRQIISMTLSEVIGVSLADGRLLWRYPWSGGQGGITPIVNGDTVIVSSRGSGAAAFRPTTSEQPETVWETKEVSMYISNPVVVADTLFGLSHLARNQYFALDAKTGEVLWLGPPRQADNTAVVKAGNILFLLNDNSELIVVEASRSGFKPLRSYVVADSPTWAQPVVTGNRIFVKDVSSLTLWTFN